MARSPETLGPDPKGVDQVDRVSYGDLVGKGRLNPLDLFDVRHYGAIGDGSHDDTAAIARAIAAAVKKGGGQVYLPPGTYKTTAAIVLASEVTLAGAGLKTIIQRSTGTGGIVEIPASNRAIIQDLRLDGVNGGSGRDGVLFTGAWGVGTAVWAGVRGLYINNCDNGIAGKGVESTNIFDCHIKDCTGGVVMEDAWINVTVNGVSVRNSTIGFQTLEAGQNCQGVRFIGCDALICASPFAVDEGLAIDFIGCVFDQSSDPGFVRAGSQVHFTTCWFSNTLAGSTDAMVFIEPSIGGVGDVTFSQCNFHGSPFYAVVIQQHPASSRVPTDISFDTCIFADNGSASDGGDILISSDGAMRVNIRGCNLRTTAAPRNIAMSGNPISVFVSECRIAKGISPIVVGSIVVRECNGYQTVTTGRATGTGAQQTIAHGLALTPSPTNRGHIFLTKFHSLADPYVSAVPDATNIYITSPNASDFEWMCEILGRQP